MDLRKANGEVIGAREDGRRRPRRLVALSAATLVAVLVLGAGGAAYATFDYTRDHRGRILPGATIGGVDVGGMSRAEAIGAVNDGLAPRLDRSIILSWRGREWTLTPRQIGASAPVANSVDAALAASAESSFLDRMSMRLFDRGLYFHRDARLRYPRSGIDAFVSKLAAGFDRRPQDAFLDYSSGWVEIVKERNGRKVRQDPTRRSLLRALHRGSDEVDLAVRTIDPEVTRDAFDQVLLVRIGENKLYLYEDGRIVDEWLVATGLPEYPTPTGVFSVEAKRFMPTWINPAPDGWGASMPDEIGPGLDNPLGLRAINWTAPGIRFHGTQAIYSLGHNASHGCVRMSNEDVIDLYDRIEVGTPIVSLQAGAYSPLYDDASNN